jgi:cytochrome c biogenesis protein CcmG, thiol:disulfide interchange protein DsbE
MCLYSRNIAHRIYVVLVCAGMVLLASSCASVPAPTETQPSAAPVKSAPEAIPSPHVITTAVAAPVPGVVAVIGTEPVTRSQWQQALALDRAMSRLAGQPEPDPSATLDRLINELLVLRQADGSSLTATDAQVVQRLARLMQTWRVDDAALDRALADAGLRRGDLLTEIKRLLVVEAQLKQVAQTQDERAWMLDLRRRARVAIYADLSLPASLMDPGSASAAEVAVAPTTAAAATGTAPTTAPTTASTAAPAALTPAPSFTPAETPPSAAGAMTGERTFDFALPDARDNGTVRLDDLRGQVVVLNFWASWCPPCRQEAAAFEAARQRYADSGVTFLGVDLREDAVAVNTFASQYGLTYRLLLDGDGAVAESYRVQGIPTTLILDAAGVVRARHVGPLSEEQISRDLDSVLASSWQTPAPPTTTTAPAAAPAMAPAFELPAAVEGGAGTIRLADYTGKSGVVLVFYRGQT